MSVEDSSPSREDRRLVAWPRVAMTASIAIVVRGDSRDPASWSGIPNSLARGLQELGIGVRHVSAELDPLLDGAAERFLRHEHCVAACRAFSSSGVIPGGRTSQPSYRPLRPYGASYRPLGSTSEYFISFGEERFPMRPG